MSRELGNKVANSCSASLCWTGWRENREQEKTLNLQHLKLPEPAKKARGVQKSDTFVAQQQALETSKDLGSKTRSTLLAKENIASSHCMVCLFLTWNLPKISERIKKTPLKQFIEDVLKSLGEELPFHKQESIVGPQLKCLSAGQSNEGATDAECSRLFTGWTLWNNIVHGVVLSWMVWCVIDAKLSWYILNTKSKTLQSSRFQFEKTPTKIWRFMYWFNEMRAVYDFNTSKTWTKM